MTEAVRPTRRCLTDLDIEVPDLGTRLSELQHPLISKSQRMPDEVASGASERIRALTDRTWFKVKTGRWRGAVVDLVDEAPEQVTQLPSRWWIGAAGRRQDDSAQHDFYVRLTEAAHRAGSHTCSTPFLIPGDWDVKRLRAEAAVNAQNVLEQLVRTAAAESLLNSDIRGFVVAGRDVRIRVRLHDDGQAYIGIGATGSLDVSFFVALVSAVPGVPVDDWLPEPDGGLGIEPLSGELIWSAMLTAAAKAELLQQCISR